LKINIKEKDQLEISTIVLAFALAIAFLGGTEAFDDLGTFFYMVFVSAIVLFLSFGVHELSHRFVARQYGFNAEYRMWIPGLIIAVGISFTGFVFLAPGAVVIKEITDDESVLRNKNKLSVISLVGPASNIILAVIFIVLFGFLSEVWDFKGITFLSRNVVMDVVRLCLLVNVWFGLFNMVPIPPLDGWKVLIWNKGIWSFMAIVALGLFLSTSFWMDYILSLF
jgi:Zn-dependent protease